MYILLIATSWQTLSFMLAVMLLWGFIGGVIFMTWDYRVQNRYVEKQESKVINLDDYEMFESSKYEWEKESVN